MDGGDVSYASLVPYLFMFAIVALLLGILMFALITLSDLESDLVNPHDCAVRLNSLLLPEIVLQSMLCTFFMVTLSVTGTVTNLPLLVYNLRMFFSGKMELDVTEIFKQLPGEKRQRMVKLVMYMVAFVIVVFHLAEVALTAVAKEHGKDAVHHIVKEAVSSHVV